MNNLIETTVQNAFTAPEPQRQDAQPADPAERGLRSSRGIRWLLLAGALVTGVSVFRLVQAQWAAIPVQFQFLILVGGSLALFGLGMVTRRRLHLPYAGAALLFLFTGLVPVLSWGAAVLPLLDSTSGWLAYGAGVAALLGATCVVLRSVLGYKGVLYPAALGVLLTVQPVLPWLASRTGWSELIYAVAALGLGAVLHVGSRHANRFFFHRDRRDGVERPVHWVPFTLLGLLYAGALMLLNRTSDWMALPVAVIGFVLATTGEEYYAALVASTGTAPQRWPRRSVALCGLGFALVAAAVPLALRDGSLRCLALVAAGAAALCLRWGVRYRSAGAWAAGLLAAVCAFQTSPALARGFAIQVGTAAASILGIHAGSPALIALGHLIFLAALVGAAAMLRYGGTERMRRTHAVALSLHAAALTTLALLDPASGLIVLPFVLALTALGVVASRRIETVPACQAVLAALVLCAGQALFGQAVLVSVPSLLLLGCVALAVLAIGHFSEAGLARFLGAAEADVRQALVLPAVPVALALGAYGFGSFQALQGAAAVMLAGALLAGMAFRFRHAAGFTAGLVAVSLGAHVALYDQLGRSSVWLALLSQAGFVLCRLAARRKETLVGTSARAVSVWHAALGGLWLFDALVRGRVTIEPLILAFTGVALLVDGLKARRRDATGLGLGLIAAWLPVQTGGLLLGIKGMPLDTAFLAAVCAGALSLALLILAARRGAGEALLQELGLGVDLDDLEMEPEARRALILQPLRELTKIQGGLTILSCLLFAGPFAALAAALLTGLIFFARLELAGRAPRVAVPLRPSLLLLLQLAALPFALGSGHLLIEVLLADGFSLLPLFALGLLIWRITADSLGRRWTSEPWATGAEAFLAIEYGAAFLVRPHLGFATHLVLLAAALGWSALAGTAAVRGRRTADVWAMQAWGGIAVLHAFTAGWLQLGSAAAPYVLLAAGAGLYVLAAWWRRDERTAVLAGPCHATGLALPLVAGLFGLLRMQDAVSAALTDVWFPALAVFLVSLFYMIAASRGEKRVFPSLASAGFLAAALLTVTVEARLGAELYSLGPGLALLALAWMLRAELGSTWSRHFTAAGAACVYATPIIALSGSISWAWLAALLVLTVVFGALSFALRSRSLLTVSTAAMLTDLGFFVFRIGTKEPTVLWILGLVFGLALMGAAAWLEYQREGVLQQIRVFGRELKAWS